MIPFRIVLTNKSIDVLLDDKMWKYVDDVSTSESLSRNCTSITQSTLNSVQLWASDNWMKLNIITAKSFVLVSLEKPPN